MHAALLASATRTVETAGSSGLLSTIAGNAATLVGIVGGFTVARVVALAGERNGLTRQLTQVQGDRETAERVLEVHDASALRDELDRAVWAVREQLTTTSGTVGGDVLVHDLERQDYDATVAELVERLDRAAAAVRDCLEVLHERADVGAWPTWPAARGLLEDLAPDEDPDLLRYSYDVADDRRKEREDQAKRREEAERRAAERRARGGLAGHFAGLDGLGGLGQVAFPVVRPRITPKMLRGLDRSLVGPPGRLQPPREPLERRLADLREDERRLASDLARLGTPPDLVVGLLVLAFFAAVSIALPIGLAGLAPDLPITPWRRRVITGLFLVSLAALLLYVARTLRTASGRPFWRARST